MPWLIDPISLWLIGGDYRKVPFDGQLCPWSKMATTAASWISFPSIKSTNAWVNWSDFSVAYWGWLEEGSFWWSAPPLIQDGHQFFGGSLGGDLRKVPLIQHGHNSSHLGFGFRRLSDECLRRLVRVFVAHWGSSIFTIFHLSLVALVKAYSSNSYHCNYIMVFLQNIDIPLL
jgi:hypothetical protein